MQTYATTQTAIEIRRDVPPTRAALIDPEGAAGYVLDDPALARKHAKSAKRVTDAWGARVAVHDGPPQTVYEANVELKNAEHARDEVNVEVSDWLDANIERLDAESRAASAELAERIIEALDGFELELQESARRRMAVELVKRRKSLAAPLELAPLKITGGESLHNLRVGCRALLAPAPPLEEITQLEHRRRVAAGESIEGTKINHSPDGWLPRGSELP